MKCNFHTHTIYCDGKDTPEELVEEALRRGLQALGFSGHSYNEPDRDFAMSREAAAEYRSVIAGLKEKYRGKIRIYCGIEQDYFSEEPTDAYDYVIASVHYVKKGERYLAVDESAEALKNAVEQCYNGDFDALSEAYFSLEADVLRKINGDIIGHFDLVSKYSEANGYSTRSERFLAAAEKAVNALAPYGKPFEINTGAIARGIRTIPYPAPDILNMIFRAGGEIILSSDCHRKDKLDCAFEEAATAAYQAGFRRRAVLTENGMAYLPLRNEKIG